MLTITKKFSFEAAHRLPEYDGKCANLHGHRWELEVEVEGPPCNGEIQYSGILFDFSYLKKIIHERIIDMFDHSYINNFCTNTTGRPLYIPINEIEERPCIFGNPTCENITQWIQKVLFYIFRKNLVRIRLYETKDSYVEWRRDENK
jgi:6-pyruvoyltetrahydropterin/6-carboxytetrahydropterin synthase